MAGTMSLFNGLRGLNTEALAGVRTITYYVLRFSAVSFSGWTVSLDNSDLRSVSEQNSRARCSIVSIKGDTYVNTT